LVSSGQLVLQLHSFDVEHDDGPIGNRGVRLYGNGVFLWFEVDDIDAVLLRSSEMGIEVVLPRIGILVRIIENVGYVTRTATVVVASPDGSAGPPP
jgi:hypothetical protein